MPCGRWRRAASQTRSTPLTTTRGRWATSSRPCCSTYLAATRISPLRFARSDRLANLPFPKCTPPPLARHRYEEQARDVVEIYDTTLRDGTQGESISLSVNDKLRIAAQVPWNPRRPSLPSATAINTTTAAVGRRRRPPPASAPTPIPAPARTTTPAVRVRSALHRGRLAGLEP